MVSQSGAKQYVASCPVCMDCSDEESWVAFRHCGHLFHTSCGHQSIETAKKCPVCRKKCTASDLVTIFLSSEADGGCRSPKANTNASASQQSRHGDTLQEYRVKIAELLQTNEALKKTKAVLEENNVIFQEEAKKAKDKNRALKSERMIEKSSFEDWRKRHEHELASYKANVKMDQDARELQIRQLQSDKRELLQQNETLQMRVNRYQATAKLNKAELGRKDLEAEEFVARYTGSEEDLKVALAWTYAEFKKSSSQADTLEKQFKESQAARQLEAAEAMREWKAKLEASQGICKARALRINELEAQLMQTQLHKEENEGSEKLREAGLEEEYMQFHNENTGVGVLMSRSLNPQSRINEYPRGGFGAAVAASLRDPLVSVSVDLSSPHESPQLPKKLPSDKPMVLPLKPATSLNQHNGNLPAPKPVLSVQSSPSEADRGVGKSRMASAPTGPSFMGKAVSSSSAYGGLIREGPDGRGGMARTLTSHTFMGSKGLVGGGISNQASRKRVADLPGEQSKIESFFTKHSRPSGGSRI